MLDRARSARPQPPNAAKHRAALDKTAHQAGLHKRLADTTAIPPTRSADRRGTEADLARWASDSGRVASVRGAARTIILLICIEAWISPARSGSRDAALSLERLVSTLYLGCCKYPALDVDRPHVQAQHR
jgi:hypothetical protein